MRRVHLGVALAVAGLLVTGSTAGADVKKTEKTLVKFEGMLGRMMGLFGGRAAKDGTVNTVSLKGDRMMTATEESGTLVDLAEEKVYEVNFKDKSYRVVTFAEMRKQIEEARAKAEEAARKQQPREEKKDPSQKEMEMEFSAKDTGQTRVINGFNCREVLVTLAIHEKGKTLEQAGGMLMTADTWLTPTIPGMKEVTDFNIRYAKKLAAGGDAASAASLAQAFAMYPGMKEGMAKLQAERVNMDGTAIETVTTMQSVQTAEQAAASKQESAGQGGSPAGGLGGMLGRFGRKKEEPKDTDAAQKGAKPADNKVTIMTSTSSVLSVGTTVADTDVAVPAGFKLK
jgi:hypothetical protein